MDKSIEYTELKECKLKKAPDFLPEQIKTVINEIIEAINYVKTNPYISYFSMKRPHHFRRIEYEKDSDDWYRYLKHLNRKQRCFCLIDNEKTAEIWRIFEKNAKPEYNYSIIYEWITNTFCRLIAYEEDKFFLGVGKDVLKKLDIYREYRRFPEKLLEKSQELFDIFYHNITLIAPDGADCLERLDKDNPEDRIYLDENGNPPYKMNWDILITDDEYFEFIAIFKKILEKLQNRIKLNNTREKFLLKTLHDPQSRKRNTDGSLEIYFAKQLYVKFMQNFNKPLYKAIGVWL